jgi:hypothetical protein
MASIKARLAIFVSVLVLSCASALAELPQIRLLSAMPMGGRLGSEFELSIEGADLDDAHALHFSSAGITARPKMSGTNIEANQFIVTISTNAPVGRCELRVSGRFGISNPRSFVVSDLKEVLEIEPNNTPEKAQKIELNTVVNGKMDSSANDYFQFHAEKDQRIIVEIAAGSIDSKALPAVIVLDPSGAEIARARDKEFLEVDTTEAGDYRLELHDLTYAGGRDYFYRLGLGTFPHIDWISPGVGKPGEKSAQKILGRNLPGGKASQIKGPDGKALQETDIELEFPSAGEAKKLSTGMALRPASAQIDGFEFRLKNDSGTSNPYLLSFSTDPVIAQLETESFELKEIPCTYSSRFHPGKKESLTFAAKKGDHYTIELTSERLGFPSDPFLVVQKISKSDKGEIQYSDVSEVYDRDENLGGQEFKTSTRDVWYQFKPSEDGQYRVLIQDLFDATRGKPALPYLLSIRRETPDFELAAFPATPPNPTKDGRNLPVWASFLRKGDKIPLRIVAFRKGEFNGDVTLAIEGLPAGVTFSPASIKAGQNAVTVILSSAVDASPLAGPIKIVGSSAGTGGTMTREARAFSTLWPVEDFNREAVLSRISRDLTLAVADKELAPVALDPAEDKTWETSVANKIQIPLKITRRGEFNNPLKFKVLTEPPKEFEVDGKATNANVELDVNQAKLAVGEHHVIVLAQTSGKYKRLTPEEIKRTEEQVKSANEQIAAADKEIASLNEQQKSAEEKKKAELAEQVKQKQTKKDSLNAQIKSWNQQIQASDVNFTVYCSALHIKITPAPIQFASAPSMSLKRGAKTELTIQMKRLYGYKDAIELALVMPKEIKGISVPKVSIPGDQAECKLVFESAADATMGEKKATLVAIAKLNNQELKIEQAIGLTVTD